MLPEGQHLATIRTRNYDADENSDSMCQWFSSFRQERPCRNIDRICIDVDNMRYIQTACRKMYPLKWNAHIAINSDS